MVLTEEEKRELELKIIAAVIKGLEDKELRIHQLYHMAEAIMERIVDVKTHEDFIIVLESLSEKWNTFNPLLEEERERLKNRSAQ